MAGMTVRELIAKLERYDTERPIEVFVSPGGYAGEIVLVEVAGDEDAVRLVVE